MNILKPLHISLLQAELKRRKEKNERYSLRAFASFLQLDPSALSRILSCKQELSLQTSLQVIRKLKLGPNERAQFIRSIAEEKYRRAYLVLGSAAEVESPDETEASSAQRGGTREALASFNPDQIVVIALDGRIVHISPSPFLFAGPAEDPLDRTVHEIGFPPEVSARMEQQQRIVIESAQPLAMEFELHGEHYRRVASPIRDASGEVEGVLIHARNITAEKRAERRAETLFELNAAYASLLDLEAIARTTCEVLHKNGFARVVTVRIRDGNVARVLASCPALAGIRDLPLDDPHLPYAKNIETGEPIWLDPIKPTDGGHIGELAKMHSLAAGVALPFGTAGTVSGFIGLGFGQEGISDENRVFLLTVAAVCGQALERARLFEELRDQAAQARQMLDALRGSGTS